MDLYFGSYRDIKQKISYRDIRKYVAIHDIIVISHRPTQHRRKQNIIPYSQKFWQGIYFGRLAVLRAIHFIRQKLHSMMSSLLQNHSLCTRPAAKCASLIIGMDFTIESCVRGHRFSKKFCTAKEKSWLVCQREEGDLNDVYTARTGRKQSRLSVTTICIVFRCISSLISF